MRMLPLISTALLSSVGLSAHAADVGPFQIHGFAAQSYIASDNNQFFGDSDGGSFEFTEAGINARWNATDRLTVAAQLVARDAGETDDGNIRLDYGFVEYKFLSSPDHVLGVRLGRAVNPYGFYNESRDVASSRPSILLPQSIYFDVNRNLALSSDGAYLFYDSFNEWGDLQFTASVFHPRTRDPDLEPAVFGADLPGEWEPETSWMARLIYDYDFGRIRVGLTAANIELFYDAKNTPLVPEGDFQFVPIILSGQYQTEKWTWVAEYAKRTTELSNFILPDLGIPIPQLAIDFTGTSFYVQGSYRFSNKFSAFARYDDLTWDDDDTEGEAFSAATGLPNHYRYAEDLALGLRWDINKHYMASVEAHTIQGTGWLSLLENSNPLELEEDWNMLLLTISGKF